MAATAAPGARERPVPERLQGGRHGLSRNEVTASQRRRIKHALVECVGARGFPETHVREITDAAGVSRKTFYELYSSKEDCLFAVYDEAAACMRGVVQRAHERGVTPQERIDAALHILLEWVDAEPRLARVCLLEVPTAGLAGRKRLTATLNWLSSVMADWLGDHDVPDVMPELVVGGIHHAIVNRLINDPDDLPALGGDVSEVGRYLERRGRAA